jgi:hypothetical protein
MTVKNRIRGVLLGSPNLLREERLGHPFSTRRPIREGVRHVCLTARDTAGNRHGKFALSLQALCQTLSRTIEASAGSRPQPAWSSDLADAVFG